MTALEQLVADFVAATVPCPACHAPTGWHCAGLVCRPRRTAALEQFLGGRAMLVHPEPADRPLTPGEALAQLFMANADNGRDAANDELIEELQRRIRALRNRQDE